MPAPARTLRAAAAVAALHLLAAAPRPAPAATITPPAVPAGGPATAELAVERPGRYSVVATSRTGVALQLVDRESGPGPADGDPGVRDGRLDLLLDRGVYLLRTRGAERAPGAATLEARPFRELAPEPPPALPEGETAGATLGDLEERSWLLGVEEAGTVVLEAAGRHLADLRLWGADGWLLEAAPDPETLEPEPGRPLRALRIVARLERGTYRLTAYGGPPEPWPAGGDARPLHVRRGIPRLGAAGRQRRVTGPFGVDRYLVPASANFLRVDLAAPAPLVLEERPFAEDAGGIGEEPRARDEISKERREPAATIELEPGDSGWRLVTVRAAAGQPYLLEHLERRASYPFRASGPHWVGTVATGDPRDLVEETAVLTRRGAGAGARTETALAQVVEIDARRGWARRTNLLEPLSVFLRIAEAGPYEVALRGAAARARVLPFLTDRPRDFREPPWKEGTGLWALSPGIHVLEVEPVEAGIADIEVRRSGATAPTAAGPARPGVLFPAVELDWADAYTLHLNERPGVRRGLVLRPLPVDLTESLPLVLGPGEEVAVPALLPRAGTVRALGDDGRALAIALAGGWTEAARLPGGRHTLRIRNTGASATWASVALEAAPEGPAALPEAPSAVPAPALVEGRPHALDLARGGSAAFSLTVGEPAFYTLESTGLLEVGGTLGTRVFPAIARDAGGGSGRNFSIGRYLGAGEYRLEVRARGQSAGRLGVSLRRTPLRSGGLLRPGIPARAGLGPGEGIAYEFSVAEAGRWLIRAEAPGRAVPVRLEDADGWPLVTPGSPGDLAEELAPGRYRLVLMPEALGSRRVTLVAPVREPDRRAGHGPHPLALGVPAPHVWSEPEGDGAREPDLWEFTLPAAAEVTVELGGEMEGTIRARGAGEPGAAIRVPPGRPWKGPLPAGRHVLEAVCSRRDNRAPYTVSVATTELLAGSTRAVVAPASLPVAIGGAGLYEVATAGPGDVRVRILDAAASTVAEQEDRPDDWNVQLAARLEPGAYRVEVEGRGEAPVLVSLREIPERAAEPIAPPARREARPGDGALVAPLAPPAAARLLLLQFEADETVGVSLERRAGEAAETLWSAVGRAGAVELPLSAPGARPQLDGLRVRTWSLDRAGGAVRLALDAVAPARLAEAALARGAVVPATTALPEPVAAAEIVPERAGVFSLEGAAPWRSSAAAGRPLAAVDPGAAPIPAAGAVLALRLEPGARSARLRAARRVAPLGEEVALELPADGSPIAIDAPPAGPGPLLAVLRSGSGQPVVALAPVGSAASERASAAASGVAPRAGASLLPEGAGAVALLWDGGRPGPGTVGRLLLRAFPARTPRELAHGASGGSLGAGEALAIRLPRGPSRVRVALAPGLAAALSRGGAVESLHWAEGGALDETVESGADRFTLVNPGAAPASWSLETIPISGRRRSVAISDGWPHVASFPGAGTVRLPLAADEEGGPERSRLRVAGASGAPLLLGADGRVRSGDGLAVGAGGTLLLPHGPGTAAAWVERPGDETPGLWGSARASDWREVEPPEIVPLRGASVGLRVEAKEPAGLHLRFERPAVTLLRRPGSPPLAALHPDGVRLDAVVPAGTSEVLLRSPDGEDLRGRAEAVRTAIARLGEGAGPETVLAAGTTAFFSFAVAVGGRVGVGVRSVPDTATCTLLDAAGAPLGAGIVQMHTLAPGTYYLAVAAPAGGGAVTVRPAVAGIGPPPSGPPEDVVRGYLELERSE